MIPEPLAIADEACTLLAARTTTAVPGQCRKSHTERTTIPCWVVACLTLACVRRLAAREPADSRRLSCCHVCSLHERSR